MESVAAGNQGSDSLTSFESISIIVLLIIIVLMAVVVIIMVVFLLLLFRSRYRYEIVKWKEDILEPNNSGNESDGERENGEDHSDAETTDIEIDLGIRLNEFRKTVIVRSEEKEPAKDKADLESPSKKTVSENPLLPVVVVEVEPVVAKEKVEDSGGKATTTAADASITATTPGDVAKEDNQAENTTVTDLESPKKKASSAVSENPLPVSAVGEVDPVVAKEKVKDFSHDATATAADVSVTAIATDGVAKEENSQADKSTEDVKPAQDKPSKDDSKEEVKT